MQIIQGDLIKVNADAIVISANPEPICGDGVDAAIYDSAGANCLTDYRKTVGRISVGQAAYTQAFLLQAKYIIHTVAPMWRGGSHGERELLGDCFNNCLKLAEQLGCKSIAFPLIGTNSGRFPRKEALQIALAVLEQSPPQKLDITLVLYDKKTVETAKTLYPNIDIRSLENAIPKSGQSAANVDTSRISEPKEHALHCEQKNYQRYQQSAEPKETACENGDNGKRSGQSHLRLVVTAVILLMCLFIICEEKFRNYPEDTTEDTGDQLIEDTSKLVEPEHPEINDAEFKKMLQNEYVAQSENQTYKETEESLKGDAFCYGNGVDQNYEKAYEWYLKGAESGDAKCMTRLGELYVNGAGVTQDYEKALEYFHQAAELQIPKAMYDIGLLYEHGLGVEKIYQKALVWYQASIDAGGVMAMSDLGMMYFDGRGVEQDYEKCMAWWSRAADHGDRLSARNVGQMYENGQGVKKSYEEAFEWYLKSALLGDEKAMFNVGLMYSKGYGVIKDNTKAAEWYQLAVDAGEIRSMINLGYMYANGLGVVQDRKKARELFERAANEGDDEAKERANSLLEKMDAQDFWNMINP